MRSVIVKKNIYYKKSAKFTKKNVLLISDEITKHLRNLMLPSKQTAITVSSAHICPEDSQMFAETLNLFQRTGSTQKVNTGQFLDTASTSQFRYIIYTSNYHNHYLTTPTLFKLHTCTS